MANEGGGNFSIYLRPKQPNKSEENSLTHRFRETVAQKGHFRTITQTSLVADEEAEEEGSEGLGHDDAENGQESDEERGTLKHVNDSKQKMVQMLSAAHEQAMFLVDFVSLLESRYSDAGQLSMSQGIKQVVPPKTLAYDEWPIRELDQAEITTNQLVAQGQRLKGLNSTADELLKAAARLQDDVKKETVYWDEILSVTNAGWAVCRVSKGQHQLGVQLGFPQAGALFRYRGFVPLASSDEGTLRLGQQAARNPKKLRVRICGADGGDGSNLGSWSALAEEEIESRIHAARDSLFEEELFHELTNEARLLTSYGVKWKGSVVHVPLQLLGNDAHAKGELQLDLVQETHRETPSSKPLNDEKASHLALALKLLMIHTYEQRRERASKPPAPLTERKRPPQIATLLRPLFMHAFHHSAVLQLRRYLTTMSKIFRLAKLSPEAFQVDTVPLPSGESSHQLINSIVGPCTTDIKVTLPSSAETVLIKVRTETGTLGKLLESTFAATISASRDSGGAKDYPVMTEGDGSQEQHHAMPRDQVFDGHDGLAAYLNEVWAVDIAHRVIAHGGQDAVIREQEPEVDIVQGSENGKTRPSVRLRVTCNKTSLTLAWRKIHVKGAAGEHSWTIGGKEGLSLHETVQNILES